MNAQYYHHKNIFRRLAAKNDPWATMSQHKYNAEKALDKLSQA